MMAKQPPPQRNRMMSPVLIWILLFLVAYAAWVFINSRRFDRATIDYSDFQGILAQDSVSSVVFSGRDLSGDFKAPLVLSGKSVKSFKTTVPELESDALLKALKEKGVRVAARGPPPGARFSLISHPGC